MEETDRTILGMIPITETLIIGLAAAASPVFLAIVNGVISCFRRKSEVPEQTQEDRNLELLSLYEDRIRSLTEERDELLAEVNRLYHLNTLRLPENSDTEED